MSKSLPHWSDRALRRIYKVSIINLLRNWRVSPAADVHLRSAIRSVRCSVSTQWTTYSICIDQLQTLSQCISCNLPLAFPGPDTSVVFAVPTTILQEGLAAGAATNTKYVALIDEIPSLTKSFDQSEGNATMLVWGTTPVVALKRRYGETFLFLDK
jgi:hypothetical protein